jgi:acetyl esterase
VHRGLTRTGAAAALVVLVVLVVLVAPGLLAAVAPSAAAGDRTPVPYTSGTVRFGEVAGVPLLADAYVPSTASTRRPAVVLIHGGGWVGGLRTSIGEEAGWLAERGFVAFTVDYRLAPGHRFPAAVDDVARFVRWLRKTAQVKEFGIDPKRIGALGSSAGGHLAAMLGTMGEGSRRRGARLAAVVSWSGPMDLTDVNAVYGGESVTEFLGCAPPAADCLPTARDASPVTHVDRTDSPVLLFTADAEIVPFTQAQRMDAALTRAGVEHDLVVYAGAVHAQDFRAEAWPQTAAFFARHLGTPPITPPTISRPEPGIA